MVERAAEFFPLRQVRVFMWLLIGLMGLGVQEADDVMVVQAGV